MLYLEKYSNFTKKQIGSSHVTQDITLFSSTMRPTTISPLSISLSLFLSLFFSVCYSFINFISVACYHLLSSQFAFFPPLHTILYSSTFGTSPSNKRNGCCITCRRGRPTQWWLCRHYQWSIRKTIFC